MLTWGRICKTSVLSHLKDSAFPGTPKLVNAEMQGLDVLCPDSRRTRQTRKKDVKVTVCRARDGTARVAVVGEQSSCQGRGNYDNG